MLVEVLAVELPSAVELLARLEQEENTTGNTAIAINRSNDVFFIQSGFWVPVSSG